MRVATIGTPAKPASNRTRGIPSRYSVGTGKDIREAEKRRNVGSRAERDHVRCMPIDQRLIHGKGTLALPWADKHETNARPDLLDNRCRFEKRGYALLYGQSAHREHDFAIAEVSSSARKFRDGSRLDPCCLESVDINSRASDQHSRVVA